MWFVILCASIESYEGKETQHLPPHWSCLRGVILSRIGVCIEMQRSTFAMCDVR